MNIFINGHHLAITERTKAEVHEKLAKCLRHFDQIQSIHVILSKDGTQMDGKNSYQAEAILRVSGQEMFVKASADELYPAIGEMADMLTRQVRKHKTRLERQGVKNRGRYDDFAGLVMA
ncbi:ribosomal subunit interface protein [Moraxella caviae]|uniref:Ribosome hibernation promoting factor n=1 Tax=Moraxella caviae TaxID=34060 RepID=A0A1T0AAW1_9GAMM|nr:ribosome-associated translation inhibitor RaiA [Moraxella caviae]OOR92798.1 ribosomal subunit interface protein [Moraxella caviae]STZ14165.1 ribosome hibernation promoting factor HPF [Moraxella caviae]VEW12611.1 ribosome hibernation promoting factor HPF [Moraxella caviae]